MAADFCPEPRIDPIGDQNDVQYLFIFVKVLCIFGMSGIVRTYGAAYVPRYGKKTIQ